MIPVFNDGVAVAQLLERLDAVLKEHEITARMLLIDDASVDPIEPALAGLHFGAIQRVDVLALRRNLGHQRAIAVGSAYLEQNIDCRAVVIMDGDGEDAPEDIPRLVQKFDEEGGRRVVFAARMKRSESLLFVLFSHLYRFLHLLLTGVHVRVGNFGVIPYTLVRRLVVVSELWNHYAAAVFRSRIPYTTVPTRRAARLAGRSQMNFVALVVHGFSAISVFSEHVTVRLFLLTGLVLATVVGVGIAFLAGFSLTDPPSLGGMFSVAGLLAVLLLQSLVLGIGFVLLTLNSRSTANFLRLRDYCYFIDGFKSVDKSLEACEGGAGVTTPNLNGRRLHPRFAHPPSRQ
jgi:hypothetical protein